MIQLIKIDAVAPTISNVRLENADVWKNKKYIYADFEDTGSGLAGYIITDHKETSNGSAAWQKISGKVYNLNSKTSGNKITSNGTYYIYVKDIARNISKEPAEITIAKIDTTAPTCTNSGDSTTWSNTSRTIYFDCDDGNDLSKCDPNYSGGSMVIDSTARTITITSYVIKDNAGNSTTCEARTNK